MFLFKILALKDKIDQLEQGVTVVEKWVKDPVRSASEYARDMVVGYVSIYIFIIVLILIGLGILGFAPILGGPHQPARVLFYAFFVIALLLGSILVIAYLKLRKIVKDMIEKHRRERARDITEDSTFV